VTTKPPTKATTVYELNEFGITYQVTLAFLRANLPLFLSQEERVSSVSNESRRDDAVRRTKDEYYTKEAEAARKHKTELRNLTEQFQKEVEDLKSEHSAKVQQLQGYMRSRLTNQEQEHQDQMQEMRDVYSQQQRKKLEESQVLRDEQKQAYESQMGKQKNVFDVQRSRLENQFTNELKKKEESFENYAKFARDESDKTWQERRGKLQKSTEDQLQRERSNHDTQMSGINRQLGELRKSKESEVSQLKMQNEFEKNRLESTNLQNKTNQERMNSAVHESMARDTQNQQQLMKGKYREELDAKIAAMEDGQNNFRQATSERINKKLNSLKADIQNEKNERVVEKTSLERQADLEKKHVVTDYEKRLANERSQKQEALAQVNDQVGGEVEKAVKSRDVLLKKLSDEHLREREMKRTQNAAQMSQMQNDLKSTEEHANERADAKVGRANELIRQNNVKMQKYYGENIDQMKKDYMKELNEERIRHIDERAELESRLEKKVRDRERNLSGEFEQKVLGYEDQLEFQKEKFQEDVRRQDEIFREQLQARERNHKDAIKSLEMKYQGQIQQTKDTYGNDMEAMERRHREEMNNLAQKMSQRQKRV
jgi:hypothetical protein